MATTPMSASNSLAVKLYEKKQWNQSMQKAQLGHMFNRGCVYFPEELLGTDKVGDEVTFSYVGKLTGMPIGEGGTLDGNEEALDLNSNKMVINVTRAGVSSPNKNTIEQQRTKVPFSQAGTEQLQRRAVEFMDTSLWHQLAGVNFSGAITLNGTTYTSAAEKLHIQGHNTPVAPTSDRIIRAGSRANDQSLTSTDIMAIDLIDYALEKQAVSDQPMEMLDGETFDLYLAPEQVVDLQHNSSAKIKWYEIEFNKIAGGRTDNELENSYKNNMICVGRYRNVFIYQASRIPNGISSADSTLVANTKRAVLVGRDAVSFASPFGGRPSDKDVPLKMFSQTKDFDYYKAHEARLIYGLRKISPTNKQDVGSLVIATYAASHS